MTRYAFMIAACLVVASINAPSRVMAQDEGPAAEYGHSHDMDDLAHEEFHPRHQQSMLSWTFNSLGWRYTLALPFAGLFSFVLALVLVIRGGSYSAAALLFVVPIPLLIGILGFFDGMIASFQVLAVSNSSARPWEVAEGISTSLVTPLVGMFLMAPAYLVAMGGLFIRALMGERETRKV